ncbi:MAG: ABC transporter substrate-binding protein [Syntrophales bacterium]|nr:ABC transporter substrate-binding protein [Syntrophales bacterium]
MVYSVRKVLSAGVVSLALVFLLFGTAVCADEANTKIITVAGLYALSGPASPWGIKDNRGCALGFDIVNEKGGFVVQGQRYKWNYITYDHRYIPAEAVKAIHRAIHTDGAKFATIQGGAQPLACQNIMHQYKILNLNPSSAAIINTKYPLAFNYNPSIVTTYASVFPMLKKRDGIKTIASINRDDEGGKVALKSLKMISEINDLEIIAAEVYEPGATKDFAPILTKILAKNPDLIETGYSDPTSVALMTKQARELGYKGIIWLVWGPDVNQVLKIAGTHAEGAYLGVGGPIEAKTPIEKEIRSKFIAKHSGKEWDGYYYNLSWMPTVLTEAIVKSQSLDAMTIAGTLAELEWEGPQGVHGWGGEKLYGIKRQLLRPVTLLQIQNGKDVWIANAPVPPGVMN